MEFTTIQTQTSDWSAFDSKYRLKYLNLIANKHKLIKNCQIHDDVFFADFIKNQKMVAKENQAVMETEFNTIGFENFDATKPSIYCSFRIGAFMSIPAFLLKQNIDLVILASKESYNKAVALTKINTAFENIDIIQVNDPKGFRKIITESRKGKSFFCLIDVGRSVNDNQKRKAVIDFADAQIETMVGIPYLSHVLKVPLIPIFSYRKDGETYISIEKEIDQSTYKDRMEFGFEATHLLWKKFETYFLNYPTQWESLYYVRDFLKEESPSDIQEIEAIKEQNFGFNEQRYTFLINDQKFFLYDYETCHQFNISEYMFVLFNKIKEVKETLSFDELKSFFQTEQLVETFLQKRILIPA
jgi:hypothetical protein